MHKFTTTHHFRKQLIFNTLFISAIVIAIWIISIFFSISYSEKQFQGEMQQKVDASARCIGDAMSKMQNISLQASLFSWTDRYSDINMEMKDLDGLELNKAFSEITGLKAISPIVKNISIVFPKSNLVISDYGATSLDEFWSETFGKEVSKTSPYLTNRNPSTYYFLDSIPNRSNTSLFTKPISFEKKDLIFIFIDSNRLLYELYKEAGVDNVIINIYDNQKNPVLREGSNTLTYDQAAIMANESGLMVFRSTTEDGWIVEFALSNDMMQPMITKNILILSLVMLLIELLTLPLSYLLSMRNYRPVSQMIDAARGTDYQNVLELIQQTFSQQVVSSDEMNIYKPLLRTAFINQLSVPNADIEKILKSLSSLGTELKKDSIMLIAFSSLDYQKVLDQITLDYYSIAPNENKFLINGTKEELERVDEILRYDEELDIYISLSTIHPLYDCSEAFKELDETIKYRSTKEDTYILSFNEIDSEIKTFDFSSLKTLELAIKAGKQKEARSAVEEFFYENVSNVMTISSILQMYTKLLQFFSKLASENSLSLTSLEELRSWDINTPDSISKLMENAGSLSQDILREMKQAKTEEDQKELEEILSYLNEHIQDPSISLSLLAEKFSVSESTISRIIRQITGEGFLDYINSARIEKACELLKESELNINSIALSVGYTNDITFRRLFKKIHGVSPTEYRSINV